MARSRRTRLTILCEDLQHDYFVRHYFLDRGFRPHEIRIVRSSQGRGAGEQFVREHFPAEVQAYRQKASHQSVALVVVIDADTQSVAQRINSLNQALRQNGQAERQPNDRIALFVPKRNIETWIHYPLHSIVDEETVYPKLGKPSDCLPAVRMYVQTICPSGLPNEAPPSLHVACQELARIL